MSNNKKRGHDNTSPQRSESMRPVRTQPPRLIISTLTSDRFDSSPLQPVPTPDSQIVYNTMRDAAAADRLTAPSVRSATMSRSPSAASSNSLSNGIDDLRVQEPPSPNTRKRKQPKRSGPLTEAAKTKAAFLRRIGACKDCRNRKVTCQLFHHDLRLFEQGYMERAHLPPRVQTFYNQSSPPGPPAIDLLGLLPMNYPSSAPGLPPLSNLPQDLIGVGGDSRCHQPSAPSQHELSAELETMLREGHFDANAVSPVTAMSYASPMLQNGLVSPATPEALSGRHLFNPISRLPSPTISLPAAQGFIQLFGSSDVAQKPNCVPIGRLIDNNLGFWECRGGGHHGGGTPSMVSSTNTSTVPEVCLRHLASLQELLRHYNLEHGRYQHLEDPYMYKCSGCQFLSHLAGLQCPSCDRKLVNGSLSWEQWYYVSLLGPASLAAERITSVPSGAGLSPFQFHGNSSSGFSPSTQPFNGSYSNLLHPSQQYYRGADGRGRHRKNKDTSGSASEKARDDLNSEPQSAKSACPFRQLVPATLEPMCSPVDNKMCGWRQPSRSRSRSRRRSRSRPCMPSPRGSSCPLSVAGRPAAALLLATGRWLLPLLLAVFLLCALALSSSVSAASPPVGDVDVLGPLSRTRLQNWVLLSAGGLLGTWLLGTVSAGVGALGRLRMGENAGLAAPNLVAGVV
ncbi:hypothetical protein GGTG_04855 [Gaeumannomyces tritici R3-111a-1]|uniref:Uncharacterized protein n=1 Tax=Gaeumannomyces tritici (strain R3-111a-1) TaxID=644352 RepID=J3NUA1_GAET3|nr:hypothetical protein GGTG_04855 [Gaeumannomyces tritici R3-111a-1]EJT79772.1 hypothetical protein GGTG_04855 [Gaeumannomyces tritici R3-111a-1]